MSALETFVIEYVRQAGGLVEPQYGIYETLLPDDVAEQWGQESYLQLAFEEMEQEGVTLLGYSHPLVEHMATEARANISSTAVYINNLNLTKTGLAELAMKEWPVINGRVMQQRHASIKPMLATYLYFNFKAAIISNEKQERLVSVLLDAHTGMPIFDAAPILQRAISITADDDLRLLRNAPMRWWLDKKKPLSAPLDQRTLTALLEQAQTAVTQQLSEYLDVLQTQNGRFRELDEARLTDYYDGLEQDLQQRHHRATTERQENIADKLKSVKAERARKLASIIEHSQLRLNLTLLNLMVIRQPKLVVPVNIENRVTKIRTYAVWDPLLHQLEPLICDVCHLPADPVYLCQNGHFAHKECLMPACVDCKRVFCTQCDEAMGECDVCHEPLCQHSRITCSSCGRGVCQVHQGMCHANDGEPVETTAVETTAVEETAVSPPASTAPNTPPPKPPSPKQNKSGRKPIRKRPKKITFPKGTPKPKHIEIVVSKEAIAAFVLGTRARTVARRVWELVPEDGGIIRSCKCEKINCKMNGIILRPPDLRWESIEEFMMREINEFRQEYGLSVKNMNFNLAPSLDGSSIPTVNFKLIGLWLDKEAMENGRVAFARLP